MFTMPLTHNPNSDTKVLSNRITAKYIKFRKIFQSPVSNLSEQTKSQVT